MVACMTETRVEISEELIRELLREQQPDLADRPLKLGARGWDNQLWRLGDDLRFGCLGNRGCRRAAVKGARMATRYCPEASSAGTCSAASGPSFRAVTSPWIVTTWVPGEPADRAPATRGAEAADTLAAFLTALHQVAPEEAPAGRNRGGPLRDSAKNVPYFLKETTDRGLIPDPDAVRAVWNYALAAPDWTGTALWLHGDLHPANLRDRSSLRRTPGPAAGADSAG